MYEGPITPWSGKSKSRLCTAVDVLLENGLAQTPQMSPARGHQFTSWLPFK